MKTTELEKWFVQHEAEILLREICKQRPKTLQTIVAFNPTEIKSWDSVTDKEKERLVQVLSDFRNEFQTEIQALQDSDSEDDSFVEYYMGIAAELERKKIERVDFGPRESNLKKWAKNIKSQVLDEVRWKPSRPTSEFVNVKPFLLEYEFYQDDESPPKVPTIDKSDSQLRVSSIDQERGETINQTKTESLEQEESETEMETFKMKALHPFQGRKGNELSFQKGDIIRVLEKNPSGWWKGEVNGVIGKFPANYCEQVTDQEESEQESSETQDQSNSSEDEIESKEKGDQTFPTSADVVTESTIQAKARWEFHGTRETHLSFAKGDIIQVLQKHPSGWWTGQLNGKIGRFPQNYCIIIHQNRLETSTPGKPTQESSSPKKVVFSIEPPQLIEKKNLRFLIFNSPSEENLQIWIKIFRAHRIKAIIRACQPTYLSTILEKEGISLVDLFVENDFPTEEEIEDWLELCDETFLKPGGQTLGLHSDSAPERSLILVAIALIESGMGSKAAIKLLHEKGKGRIPPAQVKKLQKYKRRRKKCPRFPP